MHSQQHDSAFRRLEALEDSSGAVLSFTFEGAPVAARPGESVAVALLAAGITAFRANPVTSEPRAPHCLMGVCFECLVEIEGMGARQACLTPASAGMVVRRLAQEASGSSFEKEEPRELCSLGSPAAATAKPNE